MSLQWGRCERDIVYTRPPTLEVKSERSYTFPPMTSHRFPVAVCFSTSFIRQILSSAFFASAILVAYNDNIHRYHIKLVLEAGRSQMVYLKRHGHTPQDFSKKRGCSGRTRSRTASSAACLSRNRVNLKGTKKLPPKAARLPPRVPNALFLHVLFVPTCC